MPTAKPRQYLMMELSLAEAKDIIGLRVLRGATWLDELAEIDARIIGWRNSLIAVAGRDRISCVHTAENHNCALSLVCEHMFRERYTFDEAREQFGISREEAKCLGFLETGLEEVGLLDTAWRLYLLHGKTS